MSKPTIYNQQYFYDVLCFTLGSGLKNKNIARYSLNECKDMFILPKEEIQNALSLGSPVHLHVIRGKKTRQWVNLEKKEEQPTQTQHA